MREDMIIFRKSELDTNDILEYLNEHDTKKLVGKNYHIYNTDYLLENLDREIALLQSLKEFRDSKKLPLEEVKVVIYDKLMSTFTGEEK